MSFVRPTLAQLISRAKSDIETRLAGADANLRNSVEGILARVVAGAGHSLHGHLLYLSKQIIPDTAEDEFIVRWASIWGITKISATKATGSFDMTGTNGTTCPDGTEWQDPDGLIYVQDGDVTIAGGTGTATLEAEVAGADGNQSVGVTLSLVSPVAGIDSSGTVGGSGLTGGVDEETTAALLTRLLLRLQSPPKGGGPGDYEFWALECAGVTRAWEYANLNGVGTVGVYFVMDNKVGTIIPTAGEVATVQTYIDAHAPVTADVTVYGPTGVAFSPHIHVTPNTVAVQNAVTAEIEAYLLRVSEPGCTLLLSQINEAISLAAGETDHTLVAPAADVVYAAGQIPIMGTITW